MQINLILFLTSRYRNNRSSGAGNRLIDYWIHLLLIMLSEWNCTAATWTNWLPATISTAFNYRYLNGISIGLPVKNPTTHPLSKNPHRQNPDRIADCFRGMSGMSAESPHTENQIQDPAFNIPRGGEKENKDRQSRVRKIFENSSFLSVFCVCVCVNMFGNKKKWILKTAKEWWMDAAGQEEGRKNVNESSKIFYPPLGPPQEQNKTKQKSPKNSPKNP